ncbi:hypothetical protein C6N75_17640 [Streptomyces solincola]|uniref:Cation/H+ exchanger transmembrane domain-containing protein n=1 Tax=Streptomyces solincola TaxID=2100817 RepID=A0A2S9PU20_9ACTN|nr:cation:proton antiporter [Streptomyces solincola]PRH77930.1 hypothetical protein C6N75_17640 [Streptomyces solincola]
MLAYTVIAGILFAWALFSHRLARWSITAPLAMMAAGIALTVGSHPPLTFEFDDSAFEHAVEVVLALLLFVDATEVPGAVIRRERAVVTRLLAIGLPLTLGAAFLAGLACFPDQPYWLLAALATVVIPLDLAPTTAVVRDRRIPARLREVLNVEGGLNDGLISPVFLLCLAIGAESHAGGSTDYSEALLEAVTSAGWALAAGAATGVTASWTLRRAWARGWTQASATRLAVLAVPIAAYTLSVALGGNGFVASFVAGVCFAPALRHLGRGAVEMADDVLTLCLLALWFVFGQIVNNEFWDGLEAPVLLFALLAVTLVRMLPVLLALSGTPLSVRDRLFLGWMGPRGVPSIVFGLLVVVELPDERGGFIAQVMVMTVMLSIVLHGLSVEPLARRYARRTAAPRA